MEANNLTSASSQQARDMIFSSFRAGKTVRQVQRMLRVQLKEKVSLKELQFMKDSPAVSSKDSVKTKRLFKTTGAKIVNEFLKKAKDGEDISHLQAVLEHAVYIDSLNRYASQDVGLENIDIKDLIKITNDYQKLRLSTARAGSKDGKSENLTSALALKLLTLVEEEFKGNEDLLSHYEKHKTNIVSKLKALLVEEDKPYIEILLSLQDQFAKGKGLND